MAKQGVIPDDLTKPFWDAANEERLMIQNCNACNRLQHPPAPACSQCGSRDGLEWREMSGRGKIYNYGVVYDCPVRLLQEDQPFNVAVIMLDEAPGIQMCSHLLGSSSETFIESDVAALLAFLPLSRRAICTTEIRDVA